MKRSILKVILSTALITSVGFGSGLTLCGSKVEFKNKLSPSQLMESVTNDNDILVIIHTKDILNEEDKNLLYNKGAKEISYAGINSYYLLSDRNYINTLV